MQGEGGRSGASRGRKETVVEPSHEEEVETAGGERAEREEEEEAEEEEEEEEEAREEETAEAAFSNETQSLNFPPGGGMQLVEVSWSDHGDYYRIACRFRNRDGSDSRIPRWPRAITPRRTGGCSTYSSWK